MKIYLFSGRLERLCCLSFAFCALSMSVLDGGLCLVMCFCGSRGIGT